MTITSIVRKKNGTTVEQLGVDVGTVEAGEKMRPEKCTSGTDVYAYTMTEG